MAKVSNERKNLHRLAGEFLVASRLSQRGYMTALQWGNVISYDMLVFDKLGQSAFLEVKASARTRAVGSSKASTRTRLPTPFPWIGASFAVSISHRRIASRMSTCFQQQWSQRGSTTSSAVSFLAAQVITCRSTLCQLGRGRCQGLRRWGSISRRKPISRGGTGSLFSPSRPRIDQPNPLMQPTNVGRALLRSRPSLLVMTKERRLSPIVCS
jgi:hypothetical protein